MELKYEMLSYRPWERHYFLFLKNKDNQHEKALKFFKEFLSEETPEQMIFALTYKNFLNEVDNIIIDTSMGYFFMCDEKILYGIKKVKNC